MNLPIKIKLQYPIMAGDEKLTELIIKRRPITKDLKAMDEAKGEVGKSAALLARLADIPPSWVDQLDASDFTNAAEVIGNFLSTSHTAK